MFTFSVCSDSNVTNASDASDSCSMTQAVGGGLSPWEMRRIRVDLRDLKNRNAQLKQQLEQQYLIKTNLENMYQGQVDGLTQQVDCLTKKTADQDRHIRQLRKRESTAQEELVKLKNALNGQQQDYEDQLSELRRTNMSLEETLKCMTHDMRNENSQLNRDLNHAYTNLATTSEELQAVRELNASLQQQLKEQAVLERALEEERHKLQAAELRIKDLQYEVDNDGEMKKVSRNSVGRLSLMGDLEREVTRLREALKASQDTVGNKLLLEEQVSTEGRKLIHTFMFVTFDM